ncbi:hypothetical protein GOQ27_07075 [Clostridium sp. D2Q-11]|uniref:Phage tail tape measure protein n=1 Tax=Anaeromonas frigoriresistens TaxID=2683708 RepID=A0A942UWQ4_9FIRM|nr:hypothetical protein [Anaeromonas frigoriresistens]MBS4538219.1 hypothetical protein [Anaeromonas frigoriresistens]
MELFRLYGSVLVDNKDSIKKLKESDKQAREVNKTFKNMGKAIKTMGKVAIMGGAAAGGALLGMATKASKTADAIHKGSQRMGISMKAYQELEYWASQNGLAQEQLEKGVGRLNQRMGAAADGNKKYSEALERLGINMDDVKNGTISTEDAFATAVQTLSGMKNEQEKAALATEMFGTKLARDMLPALNDGALSLEDAKKKAAELGIVIGDKAINDGVKFTDTMDSMKRSLGGIVSKIGLAVLPKLQEFLDWMVVNGPEIKAKIKDAMEKAREVTDKFKNALGFLKNNANILIPILSGLLGALIAFKVITTINAAIGKMKILMAAWKASTFAQTLAQHGLNAALLANPIGIVITIIGALIAIGVALYMNWDKVKYYAGLLWDKMKAVGRGIKNVFIDMKNGIVSGVSSAVGYIRDKFNQAKDFIMSPIRTAVNFIRGQIAKIRGFFSGLKISLPKIKLPHFSLKGKLDLIPPGLSVPKLDVKWYAKGGYMNEPTPFGIDGNSILGGGEAGGEGIVPLEGKHMFPLAEAIAKRLNNKANEVINKIILNFYPQNMNDEELERAFNYVNKRFGLEL